MPDDRFVSPGTPPSAHQTEVGIVLMEECAEIAEELQGCLPRVQQRAAKLLRFGGDETQPGQPRSNSERLGMELGDLLETVDVAIRAGLISLDDVMRGRARKGKQLQRFLQTEGPGGRIGDWVQLYSGRIFYPLDPRPEDIHIEDIAHHLAHINRYGGATRIPYSVAEHSVLGSYCVPPEHALWFLLHDAPEGLLGADIMRPLKRALPGWSLVEAKTMRAVCDRYGLPYEQPDSVTEVDNRIIGDERIALLKPCEQEWDFNPTPIGLHIAGWLPAMAKRRFLMRFEELTHAEPAAA